MLLSKNYLISYHMMLCLKENYKFSSVLVLSMYMYWYYRLLPESCCLHCGSFLYFANLANWHLDISLVSVCSFVHFAEHNMSCDLRSSFCEETAFAFSLVQ